MIINYYNRKLIDTSEFSLHDYIVSRFLFENNAIEIRVDYIEKRISSNISKRTSRVITFSEVDRFEFFPSSNRARSNEISCLECIDNKCTEQLMALELSFSNESHIYVMCREVYFETIPD